MLNKNEIRINTELESKLADMILVNFEGLTRCWLNDRTDSEFDKRLSVEIKTESLPMSVTVAYENGEIKIQTTACGKISPEELVSVFNAQMTLMSIINKIMEVK